MLRFRLLLLTTLEPCCALAVEPNLVFQRRSGGEWDLLRATPATVLADSISLGVVYSGLGMKNALA